MSTEEQQKESAFLEAVYTEMKKHPEDELVLMNCPCGGLMNCPCGGKIKAIRLVCSGHSTIIAKCNSCKRQLNG